MKSWDRIFRPRQTGRVTGALLLIVSLCCAALAFEAAAQPATEKDPDKCAMINQAHYYLACANINGVLAALNKPSKSATKEQREAAAVAGELQNLFTQVAINLYSAADMQLTEHVLTARLKLDEPHIKAAAEELRERVRMQITGKRASPRPNMLDLCTRKVLGAEITDKDKLVTRFKQFRQEADQLLARQASCLK
jgi:hypothetical protein